MAKVWKSHGLLAEQSDPLVANFFPDTAANNLSHYSLTLCKGISWVRHTILCDELIMLRSELLLTIEMTPWNVQNFAVRLAWQVVVHLSFECFMTSFLWSVMVQTIGKMWSEDIKCLTFLLGQTQPGEKSLGVRETLDCTSLEVLKITTSPYTSTMHLGAFYIFSWLF